MTVGRPDMMVGFPGFGEYTCGQIGTYGEFGYMDAQECILVRTYIQNACGCEQDPPYSYSDTRSSN
jgi:hypothetical protein